MHKKLFLLYITLCFGLISCDGGKTAKEKDAPEPAAENVICKKCNCDKKMKIIECSNKGLTKMFTVDDWTALNATKDDYEVLKLDNNQLESIDVAFPDLHFPLKVLDFRHNKIKEIVKNAFTNLRYVEEINLAFNQLTTDKLVPQAFEGKYSGIEYEPIATLKKLVLSYNLLSGLDSEIFEHTKHLQELYLDNNPFQLITTPVIHAFNDLTQLQKLDMSRMELSSLPDETFFPLKALKVLKLEGNLFKTIPNALKFTTKLRELSLDENPIGDLVVDENMLPPLENLVTLNMSYMNSLRVIGKHSLSGLENLEELRMSNNHHLSFIHTDAFVFPMKGNKETNQWPLVKRLSLNNNNLTTLDSLMLIQWTQMDEIHIHDNPFLCDCEIEWVLQELMPIINKTTPHLISHTKCASPKTLFNTPLLELSEEHYELRCLDKYGAHPERDTGLLVALFIGVLLGMPLAYASILIYRRSCGKQRGAAAYSRAFYKRADMQDDIHI